MNGRLTAAQLTFLRDLIKWDGAATSQELGPIMYRAEDAARRTCKRRGYVTFDKHYWRLTDSGRLALSDKERE